MSLEAAGWYASIFLWLYFTGIGLPPFPEEGGIGYAAWLSAVHPDVHWWGAWPAAGLGILCADMTLYGIGRLCGSRLFEYRWVQRLVKPERRQRFEHLFHSHGIKILLTARLLPPLRTGIFVVAGAVSFSFVRFLIADGIYAIFGVGLFFFCGAGLVSLIHTYANHWGVYAVAAVALAYLTYRYFRRLRGAKCASALRSRSRCPRRRPSSKPCRTAFPHSRPTSRRTLPHPFPKRFLLSYDDAPKRVGRIACWKSASLLEKGEGPIAQRQSTELIIPWLQVRVLLGPLGTLRLGPFRIV